MCIVVAPLPTHTHTLLIYSFPFTYTHTHPPSQMGSSNISKTNCLFTLDINNRQLPFLTGSEKSANSFFKNKNHYCIDNSTIDAMVASPTNPPSFGNVSPTSTLCCSNNNEDDYYEGFPSVSNNNRSNNKKTNQLAEPIQLSSNKPVLPPKNSELRAIFFDDFPSSTESSTDFSDVSLPSSKNLISSITTPSSSTSLHHISQHSNNNNNHTLETFSPESSNCSTTPLESSSNQTPKMAVNNKASHHSLRKRRSHVLRKTSNRQLRHQPSMLDLIDSRKLTTFPQVYNTFIGLSDQVEHTSYPAPPSTISNSASSNRTLAPLIHNNNNNSSQYSPSPKPKFKDHTFSSFAPHYHDSDIRSSSLIISDEVGTDIVFVEDYFNESHHDLQAETDDRSLSDLDPRCTNNSFLPFNENKSHHRKTDSSESIHQLTPKATRDFSSSSNNLSPFSTIRRGTTRIKSCVHCNKPLYELSKTQFSEFVCHSCAAIHQVSNMNNTGSSLFIPKKRNRVFHYDEESMDIDENTENFNNSSISIQLNSTTNNEEEYLPQRPHYYSHTVGHYSSQALFSPFASTNDVSTANSLLNRDNSMMGYKSQSTSCLTTSVATGTSNGNISQSVHNMNHNRLQWYATMRKKLRWRWRISGLLPTSLVGNHQ